MSRSLLVLTIFASLAFAGTSLTQAQVRQSTNYAIESDTVNFGGGFSSSTNYQQESTFGEIGTGQSSSTNFVVGAGYQQMQTSYVSLSDIAAVNLSPAIPGVTGGTSSGTTTMTVVTDSSAGYQLTIAAESAPAMQSGADTIADYVPGGGVPDYTFTTGSTDAHLGFTVEGTDVAADFIDNGVACGVGSNNTVGTCWRGLDTSAVTIAQSNNANHPAGATTTVRFQVGVGGSVSVAPGTYVATTTVTALAL